MRLPRYGTDCYAYAMVAAGNVDLVVEVGLQPYDIVALIPIIEAAGGMVTEWSGGPAEEGGGIIAAATPELHAAAMEVLHAGRSDASAESWRAETGRSTALDPVVVAGNEGVEGGEKLLAEDVGFLQEFVAGAGDGQDLAAAQAPRIVRDRARRDDLVIAGADEHAPGC